jgi:hypothetical protein
MTCNEQITPAMIEAGANVIWGDFGEVIAFGADVFLVTRARRFVRIPPVVEGASGSGD